MVVTVRVITAKFNGRCANCGCEIARGTRVNFHGRGNGITHLTDDECREANADLEFEAENRAERELEMQAEYRMAGLGAEAYYRDRDYERGVLVGNDY